MFIYIYIYIYIFIFIFMFMLHGYENYGWELAKDEKLGLGNLQGW